MFLETGYFLSPVKNLLMDTRKESIRKWQSQWEETTNRAITKDFFFQCRKNGENYTMRSLVICTLTEYCAGGKIEKNEMGGACGAYEAVERGAQGSGGET